MFPNNFKYYDFLVVCVFVFFFSFLFLHLLFYFSGFVDIDAFWVFKLFFFRFCRCWCFWMWCPERKQKTPHGFTIFSLYCNFVVIMFCYVWQWFDYVWQHSMNISHCFTTFDNNFTMFSKFRIFRIFDVMYRVCCQLWIYFCYFDVLLWYTRIKIIIFPSLLLFINYFPPHMFIIILCLYYTQ